MLFSLSWVAGKVGVVMPEGHEPSTPTGDLKARIEAERTGMPFLYWLDGAGEQHILILSPDRGRVIIGRRDQSDVPLAWDNEVSRAHAFLEPVGEDWILVDDGMSRNGSWIHGNRVQGRHRLYDKDRMCFGSTHVVYRGPTRSTTPTTKRAADAPATIPLTPTQRKILVALCRPIVESTSETPATNPEIAAEVFLVVDAVKAHLRVLFARFELGELRQNEKRARLVSIVLNSGLLERHDF